MPKLKKWQRNLARLVVFCLLAGLLLIYTDRVLWDKKGTIMGFYEEPKNSIDVLYLGGSHSNAAIAPTQMYEQHGFTGYVLYSWSQPIWTSYHYLLEGLKTQQPKVVVLESFGLVYGHTYITDTDINSVSNEWSLLIPPSVNRVQLAIAMSRSQTDHLPFYSYFSLFQYHNRWKAITKEDLLWPLQSYATTGKGYGPLYTTEAFDPVLMPPGTPANGLMEAQCLGYLQKIIDLSKEEGFQLVLATLPYVANEEEFGIYQQAYELCRQNDVPVVDYFDEATVQAAGFNWQTDMAEHAHVNYKGAAKISAHLGNWLAEQFSLPDHRGEVAYAHWDEAAAAERKNLKDMDLKMSAELEVLLAKAMDPDYTVILLTKGDLTQSDPAAMQEAYESVHLAADVFTENTCSLSILRDGAVYEQQTMPLGTALASEKPLDGADYTLTAQTDGDTATVLLNGEEVCLGRPGINVVVIDTASGRLVQSISFDAQHEYAPFTD